jgi:hypothetical protein
MSNKDVKNIFLEHYKSLACNVTQVAKRVNVDRRTIYNWLNDDDEFKQKFYEAKEELIDSIETTLMKRMLGYTREYTTTKQSIDQKNGRVVTLEEKHVDHIEPSDRLLMFYLKTIGRERGYNERLEIEDKTKYNMQEEEKTKLSKLTTEEKTNFIRLIQKINA